MMRRKARMNVDPAKLALLPELAPRSIDFSSTNLNNDEMQTDRSIFVSTSPYYDVETICSTWTGHALLQRLLFVVSIAPETRKETAEVLADNIKKSTTSTTLYRFVCSQFGIPLDEEWVRDQDMQARDQLQVLTDELSRSKENLIKESIRMACNDLGEFFYVRGFLSEALKSYIRSRDYCSTPAHYLTLCKNVVATAMAQQNFILAQTYTARADSMRDSPDELAVARLRAAGAVCKLRMGEYSSAADSFLKVTYRIGSSFNNVVSGKDVAVYGGICAFASYSRLDIKEKVLDNVAFGEFLELDVELREVLNDFYNAKYSACLNFLERRKSGFLLDIHLNDHVETLYTMIWRKILVQYCSPFSTLYLEPMAEALRTSVGALVDDLVSLINEGVINARIDGQRSVLVHQEESARSKTYREVLQLAERYELDMQSVLREANLHGANISRNFRETQSNNVERMDY